MIELVPFERAKLHPRIDDDCGGSDLTSKIQGGSVAVLSYTQGSHALIVDSLGKLIDGESLTRVQTALLVLPGYLDRNRDDEGEDKLKQGGLPFPVLMLIYGLRGPIII